MAFAGMQEELREPNAELLELSTDSTYSHIAWLRTTKEKIECEGQKGVGVLPPVISDLTIQVSRKLGMLQPQASTAQAVRAVFIIDPEGIARRGQGTRGRGRRGLRVP